MLRLQQLMDRLGGELRLRDLPRIRHRMFAHALAFHKDQRLQQQVILAGLALHVVNHVALLHVRIESENRHMD